MFGAASSSGSSSRRQLSVADIGAGRHPGLSPAAEEAGRLVKQYNPAVLADKETFGGVWPLHSMRQGNRQRRAWRQHRIGGGGGGGAAQLPTLVRRDSKRYVMILALHSG